MPQINVRPAAPADFARVAALLTELGRPALTPETADAARAVYERHVADPSAASLVAEMDGSVIGFLSLVFREHLNYVHPQGWIPDLIVAEPARGGGGGPCALGGSVRAGHTARLRPGPA